MKLRLFILSGLCAWIGVSCGGKKENTGQESIRPVRVDWELCKKCIPEWYRLKNTVNWHLRFPGRWLK